MDDVFIRREIKSLLEKAGAIAKVRKDNTELSWWGSVSFVCLYHTITDVPENKSTFIKNFDVLTTEELNGCTNPLNA